MKNIKKNQLNLIMKSTTCTTRNQLKGYGATSYQAIVITKNLQPISKSNQTNIYCLPEVIASIKEYLEKPKISQKTRQSLNFLLPILITQLDNIVPAIFEKPVDRELGKLTRDLFLKLTNLDRKITNSKALIANLQGKQVK